METKGFLEKKKNNRSSEVLSVLQKDRNVTCMKPGFSFQYKKKKISHLNHVSSQLFLQWFCIG